MNAVLIDLPESRREVNVELVGIPNGNMWDQRKGEHDVEKW
jgi:hypothetical protein